MSWVSTQLPLFRWLLSVDFATTSTGIPSHSFLCKLIFAYQLFNFAPFSDALTSTLAAMVEFSFVGFLASVSGGNVNDVLSKQFHIASFD
jgi:hypothetical protein